MTASKTILAVTATLLLVVPSVAQAVCARATRDRDNDGLTNCIEKRVTNTNPRKADTDHDGLSDGLETNNGMDPLSPDADDDGLSDGDEAIGCTSPDLPDTDGDGTPDLYDSDPTGALTTRLEGLLEAVNPADATITLLGRVIDASTATFINVTGLADLSAGMHVEVRLDPTAAASGQYVAILIKADDTNGDGVPDSDQDGDSGSASDGDSDDGSGGSSCVKTETEIHLSNVGSIATASGKAKREEEGCQTKFKVEIKDLPMGNYELRVDGAVKGSISVVPRRGGETEGEIRFRTSPKRPSDLTLDFEPRGALIEVLQGTTVLLSRIFPS